MFDEENPFDFGAWCPVCDRAIPSPLDPTEVATGGSGHAQDAPGLNRATSASSHDLPTSGSAAGTHGKGKEKKRKDALGGVGQPPAGPMRRKSSSKQSHAAGARHHPTRTHSNASHSHSHSNLAPLTATTPPITPTPPIPPADQNNQNASSGFLNPPTSLYCSEECRRIDEMRSRLAFADLGPSAPRLPNSAAAPLRQNVQQHEQTREAQDFLASMSRRRLSSTSSPSITSPKQIFNAPISGWGSSSSLASQTSFGGGAHSSNSPHGPAQTLDFSTRRNSNSRGASEGGYSYRPSLMQRVPSSDDGVSHANGNANGFRTRGSSDSLASMGDADERSDRGYSLRPPSALSALRFMTPISTSASSSPPIYAHSPLAHPDQPRLPASPRQRPPHISGRSTVGRSDGRDFAKYSSLPAARSKMLEKRSESDGGGLGIDDSASDASIPHLENSTARPTPTMSMSRSVSGARPPRTNSSASLALMGSSLGKSFHPRSMDNGGWAAPTRSESTASLSGLVATGQILPVSSLTPNVSVPRRPSIPRVSTSPESPSSNSSFARSHSSSTKSSQRSTAGSSEQRSLPPDYGKFYPDRKHSETELSRYESRSPGDTSHLSSGGAPRPSTTRGRRSNQGLMMTPSASSLSGTGSSYGDDGSPEMKRRSASSSGGARRKSTSAAERTPTQSLSKAASIRASNSGSNLPTTVDSDTTPLASRQARATSTPGTIRRPHPLPTHSSSRTSMIMTGSPSANAAAQNPSLSYLYPNGGQASATANGGLPASPPSMLASKSRNWSWDNLAVNTYTALDVDKIRRERSEQGKTGAGGAEVGAGGGVQAVGAKERKRLFYFSDVE
ncbi:hypothetical protein P7C70_g6598, partial [Phenoliferia sp. Uapishka_3]